MNIAPRSRRNKKDSVAVQLLGSVAGNAVELKTGLRNVVEWWDALPPRLRQDIEGSGAEPGCIAAARRLSNPSR